MTTPEARPSAMDMIFDLQQQVRDLRAQLAARDEAGRRILAILIRATVAEDPDEWLTDALAFIDTAPPTWRAGGEGTGT